MISVLKAGLKLFSWIYGAFVEDPPPFVKRLIILSYLKKYNLKCFVESGTFKGDTLNIIAKNKAVTCISIELSNLYYRLATERFGRHKNVKILKGDSGKLMQAIIHSLNRPALFWLDGHYSAGMTAKGKTQTPILKELKSILSSSKYENVILIDDIRHFNGKNDYPQLHLLLKLIIDSKKYNAIVSTDILRCTPILKN